MWSSGGNAASAWESGAPLHKEVHPLEVREEDMNGVMSRIIEVKPPPISNDGGLLMEKFYFTFGTSEQFPFRGGWVEVVAPSRKAAVRTFRSKYPDVHKGIVNCSDIYTAEQFACSKMVEGNLGAGCHETLTCLEV